MNLKVQKALINDVNYRFYGVDQGKLYASSGKLIAEEIAKEIKKSDIVSFVCGLGGNACDGLSTAINLLKLNYNVEVYIIGRVSNTPSAIYKELFEELIELKVLYPKLIVKQECYSHDIKQTEVVVESLIGTGIQGPKLNKRFQDCINRISHFKSKIIAIDIPAPSYTPDLVISLNYPKSDNAVVVEIPESKDITYLCGPGDVKFLFSSKQKTHKQKNGKVLYISSTQESEEFEFAKETAKQYSCEICFYNFNSSLKDFKNFRFISDLDFEKAFQEADSIIFGTIQERSTINKKFLEYIIQIDKNKKFVLGWEFVSLFEGFKAVEGLKNSIAILNRSSIDTTLKSYGISERSLSQVSQINLFLGGFQNTMYSFDGEYKVNANPNINTATNLKILCNIAGVLLTNNEPWISLTSSVFLFEVSNKLSQENKKMSIENIKDAIDLCKEF